MICRLSNAVSSTPKLNAVTITTSPVPAFSSEKDLTIQGFVSSTNYREYDLIPNGKEFVLVLPAGQQTPAPAPPASMRVVVNWFEELKSRVPNR